jgi:hypothetical protein
LTRRREEILPAIAFVAGECLLPCWLTRWIQPIFAWWFRGPTKEEKNPFVELCERIDGDRLLVVCFMMENEKTTNKSFEFLAERAAHKM